MLSFDKNKCVNCGICEEVCSFKFTDTVYPNASAIKIGRGEGRWGVPFAKLCNLCKDFDEQKCVEICPVEALKVVNNVIFWDENKCTRCGECVEVCPQKAVGFDHINDRINICDLCGGTPLCVTWCPEGALSL